MKNVKVRLARFCKELKQWRQIVVLLLIVVLFKQAALDFVDSYVMPFISKVQNYSWGVALIFVALPSIWYLIRFAHLAKDENVWGKRHSLILFALALYFLFRPHYQWYGPTKIGPNYGDITFITIGAWEVLVGLLKTCKFREIGRNNVENGSKVASPFLFDAPTTTDNYSRKAYAQNLAEKILLSFKSGRSKQSSFNILISERFGEGKTSFLNQFREIICDAHGNQVRFMEFRPWLSDSPQQIIRDFFLQLGELLGKGSEIERKLKKYSQSLANDAARAGASFFLDIWDAHNDSYVQQHQYLSECLSKCKRPIIVGIDDVDRLQANELLMVLNLIRDTADFPNVFYLIAADKKSVIDNLHSAGIKDAEFYLRKFFNFELLFPANENITQQSILQKTTDLYQSYVLNGHSSISDDIEDIKAEILRIKYLNEAFQNERDIIRFFNLLSFSTAQLYQEGILQEINFVDLFKISMVQCLMPDVYKFFRDYSDYVLTESNGRLIFNKEAKTIFEDKRYAKEIAQTLKDAAAVLNSSKETQKEENVTISENKSLMENSESLFPSVENIVCSLLSEMFGRNYGYICGSSISYSQEYYKYFAGKYKSTEVSEKECRDILSHNESDFSIEFADIVSKSKHASFLHKWESYLDDNKEVPRIEMLRKILSAIEIYILKFPNSSGLKGYQYEKIKAKLFSPLLYSLYTKRDEEDIDTTLQELEALLLGEKRYRLAVLVFTTLAMRQYEMPSALTGSVSRLDEIKKKMLDSYFDQLLPEAESLPSTDQLDSLLALNDLDGNAFKDRLSRYLPLVNPVENWFYRLIIPYDNKKFGWHFLFREAMGIGTLFMLNDYLQLLPLEDKFEQEKRAFENIFESHHKNYLAIENIEDSNIYLKKLRQWWQTHPELE